MIEEKEQQTEQEIGETFEQAFRSGKAVKIQMNYRENGLYKEDIVGIIRGFEEENMYIFTGEGMVAVELSMIRHVESELNRKWYQ